MMKRVFSVLVVTGSLLGGCGKKDESTRAPAAVPVEGAPPAGAAPVPAPSPAPAAPAAPSPDRAAAVAGTAPAEPDPTARMPDEGAAADLAGDSAAMPMTPDELRNVPLRAGESFVALVDHGDDAGNPRVLFSTHRSIAVVDAAGRVTVRAYDGATAVTLSTVDAALAGGEPQYDLVTKDDAFCFSVKAHVGHEDGVGALFAFHRELYAWNPGTKKFVSARRWDCDERSNGGAECAPPAWSTF